MNNETKIAKCPDCRCTCGGGAWRNSEDKMWRVICANPGCGYRCFGREDQFDAIAVHNALCADIEKGRKYKRCSDLAKSLAVLYNKSEAHLDTAVRLLGQYASNTNNKDCVTECNCCGSGFGFHDDDCDIGLFLKLDAIKAILKQKGQ